MRRGLRFLTGIFGWLFTLICSGIIIGCIAALLLMRHYTKDLPDYTTLASYDPPTVTRLYTSDGKLLAEYATEKRVYVPLSAIPRRVRLAFLAAEDKNFYTHTGIDYRGIARAVYTNIIQYGKGQSLVGGSTITQQVVKNFLLSNEKSLERKIKEAVLAIRITNAYSKDRILELYLNQIYLGLRSYGVAAAALNYFNKSLDDLALEEAALLAALPKAPALYDPRQHYDRAKKRRDWVIQRMQEDGHITKEEAEEAIASPIALHKRDADEVVNAAFFAEETRRWLASQYGAEAVNEGGLVVKTTLVPELQEIADSALRKTLIEYDRKRGYRGPVKHLDSLDDWRAKLTSMEQEKQQLIEDQKLAVVIELSSKKVGLGFEDGTKGSIPPAWLKWTRRVMSNGTLGPEVKTPTDVLRAGDVVIVGRPNEEQAATLKKAELETAWDLQQIPLVNGALVAMDPHTGKVLAMSGGYSGALTDFNRATQARRQPGSAFKPFVFTAALENGLTPASIVVDAPIELSQGSGMPAWRPSNYDGKFLGPITLRHALEKSRNIPTVKLGQILGIDRILEIGRRFGIYENSPRNFSIVLGASETTLMQLVGAYSMLVNGGMKITPSLIERIDDRTGSIIYRRDTRQCTNCRVEQIALGTTPMEPPQLLDLRDRVLDSRISYQIVSMLQDVVQHGTATKAKVLERPIGGKTGTTNDSRDAWFIGFSPNLVVGVYMGYDTPQSLGDRETGSSVALPAFIDFMQTALKDKPVEPFSTPSGIQLMQVAVGTGQPIEAWEMGHVETRWESFIPPYQPVFKPDSAVELGEITPDASAKLASTGEEDDPLQDPATLPWRKAEPEPYPTRHVAPELRLPSSANPPQAPRYIPEPRYFPEPPPVRHPAQPEEPTGLY